MTDREIIAICRKYIGMYGVLRYCTSNLCACLGCINAKLSKEQYEYALTLPDVQHMLSHPEDCHLDFLGEDAPDYYSLENRLKRYKENKNELENS